MVRWSPAEARKLGIDVAADKDQSAETKRRLAVEDSLTADFVFQLTKVHGLREPMTKLNGPQFRTGKWPWDVAYPEEGILIDIQGLQTHTRIPAYLRDCEKFAFAVISGYIPIPVVSPHIKSGMAAAWISEILRKVGATTELSTRREKQRR